METKQITPNIHTKGNTGAYPQRDDFGLLYEYYKPKLSKFLFFQRVDQSDTDDVMQDLAILLYKTIDIAPKYEKLCFNTIYWTRVKQYMIKRHGRKKLNCISLEEVAYRV